MCPSGSGVPNGVPPTEHAAQGSAESPSTVAGGRYALRGLIGEGSTKRVHLAYDARLDREVALALIKTKDLDADGVARVRREALAMGRLGDHPHIVTVYDVGEEAGQPYIIMQLMRGGDVERAVREAAEHRLPIAQAIRIAEQVCQALEYAHRRHIIHRDVKPGNVWLTEDGVAKLGDFGLAVALDRSRLTASGMMLGTVAYMPPEQALGQSRDGRSDLYALGAMLYEMVAGRPPFLGDDAVSILAQHINATPVAPSWHRPEIPRALDMLILRLLAKTPEERPPDAATVRELLAMVAVAPPTEVADRAESHEPNPLDRLAPNVFVGREREKAVLVASCDEALVGHGRLVQLAGEPGIGKTRLAEELATYARLRRAQVLWGRCYEGDGAPAYWPWVQMIRAYVHDRPPKDILDEMGPGAADIAEIVSAVRERLPGLPPLQQLDPQQARFRLFDSIATFLKNAASRQPLVLVLDDLHWADAPSLMLLQFVAGEIATSRILIVGSYRDMEVRRRHPLAQTLAELARSHLGERILLRGLTEADIERFIERTAGIRPPSGLAEAVHRETEGNPFFLTEIVRLLAADGRLERPVGSGSWSVGIPQSIREVIGRRLDRLSEECNRVLTVAAVVGREFRLDVLERVAELETDRLLNAFEEATAARVLTEVPGAAGRYRFAHVLIREALYEEISTIRRLRLHRRIAEVLEEVYGPRGESHLTEIASHHLLAAQPGDVDRAVAYAHRAGDRAVRLLAYEEGARLFEMALQALEQAEPPDEVQRGELMLALGEARLRAGNQNEAREAFRAAAGIARTIRAPELLAHAALGFAWWGAAGVVDEAEVALLEEALAGLPEGDSALKARTLARLAVALHYGRSPGRRTALSEESIQMARRVGDSAALAYVLNCSRWALWGPDSVEDRLAAATEILQLARQQGNAELTLESRQWRLVALLGLGDIRGVDEEIEAHAQLAAEVRMPRYLWQSTSWRAMRALLEGRFEDGERLAGEALDIGQRMKSATAMEAYWGQVTIVRREHGGIGELVPWVRGVLEHRPDVAAVQAGLANFLCDLGREGEARKEFDQVAAHGFADLPHDVTWLVTLAHLIEACTALDDVGRAALLYERLAPYARRAVVIGPGLAVLGSTCRYLGMLGAVLHRWKDAEAHFEDALELERRMGARPWMAHTQRWYGAMLLARDQPGDRRAAVLHFNAALETARALGMTNLLERVMSLKLVAQGQSGAAHSNSIEAVVHAVHDERPDLRAHAAPDGTVTFMFTDIEGFTPVTERLGDQHAHEVLLAHNQAIRRLVTAHGGHEVKSQGDGFMIAFGSAARALRCSVAIQRAMSAYSEEHPGSAIRVRIGLHTGETIRESHDFFGRAVIVAARIAAQAAGGQILVSGLVKALAQGTGEFSFDGGRKVELKGLAGEHEVYDVRW